ncbi:hypothetical protein [Hydrogenophaga sp. 2FB]|uniref:hypothetical protein n=1 Tax=Hydrogenophaga sp. 2FB TaxID=2502187 RepID=UPI0010F5986C|nr:hypothetical protein [Hydrogenophaga sp. 2FB]
MSTTFNPLLASLAIRTGPPPPKLLEGAQRTRVLELIAAALSTGNIGQVMQVLAKDPSIAHEHLQMKHDNGRVGPMPFAIACLREHFQAGVLVALSSGYDINSPSETDPRFGGLIHAAVSSDSEKDALLLLSLGARADEIFPDAKVPDNGVHSLLQIAFNNWVFGGAKAKPVAFPKLCFALMNAGLVPDPYMATVLVREGDWKEAAFVKVAIQVLARMTKAGLDLTDDWSGSSGHPVSAALGTKNGVALEALVSLGARTDGALDIFERMRVNDMAEYIPSIQAKVMNRTIQQAVAASPSPTSATGQATVNRRRTASI